MGDDHNNQGQVYLEGGRKMNWSPYTLHLGDCLEVLKTLPDSSVDAVITDPPAGIGFMGAAWDGDKGGRDQWIAWLASVLREVRRVITPGGYALVWALPRTSHWTATAVEDAGWIVQDVITHLFGTGFPKSRTHLKPASEHWILAYRPGLRGLRIDDCRIEHDGNGKWGNHGQNPANHVARPGSNGTTLGTGWNRPGSTRHDSGRWPANVMLSHSPLCRAIGSRATNPEKLTRSRSGQNGYDGGWGAQTAMPPPDPDRTETVTFYECHPSCAVAELDRQSGTTTSPISTGRGAGGKHGRYGSLGAQGTVWAPGDTGGASRFFYVAKASRAERGSGNTHPCVKPIQLLRYLCRLVTPPGGTILDPFAGSGSTGVAALAEGYRFIGIEQEPEYHAIAVARLAAVAPTLFQQETREEYAV